MYDLDRLTKLTETNLVSDFEYDDNSNLTKVQLNNVDNETFEYDIRNQLSKYTSIGNGISADYDYDFERKRLSKTVSGNRRDYVYAGNQVVNEYLGNNLNASYGIGSGEIVKSDFVGEGSRNYFSDALGSITSLADNSSSLISRNNYDSFGEIVASTGSSQNSVTYTGQRLDVESGLMPLGNGERYYNPSYGRFIQQDSYAGMPDMPQSLNRFSYGYNNPNINTDPTGNYVESLWDLASLAVGVYSFQDNIRKGNYGWAALDAVGIVADGFALAVPILPGGVGIAIKSYRAVDATVTVIQGTDRAINTAQSVYNAGDAFGQGDVKSGLLNTGFALLGGKGASESYNRYSKVNKVKTDVNSAQKATDEATDLLTAKSNPKALMEITEKEAKVQKAQLDKELRLKEGSSTSLKFDDDPLIDNNILSHANRGNPEAIEFLEGNRGLISIGKTTRYEFLAGGKKNNATQMRLTELKSKYNIEFMDSINYKNTILEGKLLRSKFDNTSMKLRLKDSRQLAEAKLLKIDLVTNDLQFFKRAKDLKESGYLGKINIHFLDLHPIKGLTSRNAKRAANYTPRKLK